MLHPCCTEQTSLHVIPCNPTYCTEHTESLPRYRIQRRNGARTSRESLCLLGFLHRKGWRSREDSNFRPNDLGTQCYTSVACHPLPVKSFGPCAKVYWPPSPVSYKAERSHDYDWSRHAGKVLGSPGCGCGNAAAHRARDLRHHAGGPRARPRWSSRYPAAARRHYGLRALRGRRHARPNLKRLTDEEWRLAGGAGFDLLSSGRAGIDFLEDLRRTHPYSRSGNEGPHAEFGRICQVPEFGREDKAFDPLRDLVRNFIRMRFPVGPGDIVFGKALAMVAAKGGVAPEALAANALVRIGPRRHLLRGEALVRGSLRRATVAICPMCLAGNIADGSDLRARAHAVSARPPARCPPHLAAVKRQSGGSQTPLMDFYLYPPKYVSSAAIAKLTPPRSNQTGEFGLYRTSKPELESGWRSAMSVRCCRNRMMPSSSGEGASRHNVQPFDPFGDAGSRGSRVSTISFIFLACLSSMDFLSVPGECSDRWVVGDIGAAADDRTLNHSRGRAPL